VGLVWLTPVGIGLCILVGLIFSYRFYQKSRAAVLRRASSGPQLEREQRRLARLFRWLVVEWIVTLCGMSLGDTRWLGADPSLRSYLAIIGAPFVAGFVALGDTLSRIRQVGRD
jgi:hypothetical protein